MSSLTPKGELGLVKQSSLCPGLEPPILIAGCVWLWPITVEIERNSNANVAILEAMGTLKFIILVGSK